MKETGMCWKSPILAMMAVLLLVGCGRKPSPAPKAATSPAKPLEGGSSPEEVFNEYERCCEGKCWGASLKYREPERRSDWVYSTVCIAGDLALRNGAAAKDLEETAKRLGFECKSDWPYADESLVKTSRRFEVGFLPEGSFAMSVRIEERERPEALFKISGKDKFDLYALLMDFLAKYDPESGRPRKSVLKDVAIYGDLAIGNTEIEGRPVRELFLKLEGRWFFSKDANDFLELIDRVRTASHQKDWRALFACYEFEIQNRLLYGLIVAAQRQVSGDPSAREELAGILERHHAAWTDANGLDRPAKDAVREAAEQTGKEVADKKMLFADLNEFGSRHSKSGDDFLPIDGTLRDLKVNCDKATATLVQPSGKTLRLAFARRYGRWALTLAEK